MEKTIRRWFYYGVVIGKVKDLLEFFRIIMLIKCEMLKNEFTP